ncbi:MAG: acyl-CoA thioesterase [Ruminococcus sp.]|nr:acyl-CoA thioesterase [Ruminococcus sp.]
MTTYSRQAQYYETDQMMVVHHSNYIRYFEEARNNFMKQIGCDIRTIESNGIVIPNVDAYAKYIKPIRFFDEFTVETKLVRFNGVSFEFEYKLTLQNGTIAATGHTAHCFATENNLSPVSIKRKFPDFYEKMKNQIER